MRIGGFDRWVRRACPYLNALVITVVVCKIAADTVRQDKAQDVETRMSEQDRRITDLEYRFVQSDAASRLTLTQVTRMLVDVCETLERIDGKVGAP